MARRYRHSAATLNSDPERPITTNPASSSGSGNSGSRRWWLVREDGLPLGGALHHIRFTRPATKFSSQDRHRAAPLAGRLGLTVELAGHEVGTLSPP
jgi:hypothetical protein